MARRSQSQVPCIDPWQQENRVRFHTALLEWFQREKRRLPWRNETSLYRTVVSEFMLQQTRVDTVIRYFEAWMARFPDFQTLAAAHENDVLKAWEGLGYYRRARNLHTLAKNLAPLKSIPTDDVFWLSQPGIGPYSAAAIRSIALKQPAACVDGNIVRILCRLAGNDSLFRDSSTAAKQLTPQANELLSTERPGDFNEAMMELGATVCVPRKPLCPVCPVNSFCRGRTLASLSEIPRFTKTVYVDRQAHRLFLLHPQKGLLLQRICPKGKRLQSFQELPHLPDEWQQHPELRKLIRRKRGISQERWTEDIYSLPCNSQVLHWAETTPELEWVPQNQLGEVIVSGPHRKWIHELLATAMP